MRWSSTDLPPAARKKEIDIERSLDKSRSISIKEISEPRRVHMPKSDDMGRKLLSIVRLLFFPLFLLLVFFHHLLLLLHYLSQALLSLLQISDHQLEPFLLCSSSLDYFFCLTSDHFESLICLFNQFLWLFIHNWIKPLYFIFNSPQGLGYTFDLPFPHPFHLLFSFLLSHFYWTFLNLCFINLISHLMNFSSEILIFTPGL